MQNPKTTSPAYDRATIEGTNSLQELPWSGKINLRGDPGNSRFLRKAGAVLELELPLAANTLTTSGERTAYWLGPDEWQFTCPIDELARLQQELEQALDGIHCAVTDVSDYYTVLELDGPDAAAQLARGCPLDLHPSAFATGRCAQTRMGHASVMLHKTSDTPTFRVQVRWSYTEYVWDYLVSALSGLDPRA